MKTTILPIFITAMAVGIFGSMALTPRSTHATEASPQAQAVAAAPAAGNAAGQKAGQAAAAASFAGSDDDEEVSGGSCG